jgi:hypothetical protein
MPIRSPDDLWDGQKLISRLVQEREAVMIIADMSQGKTGGSLDGTVSLLNRLTVQHVLMIGPRFVAMNTWPDELKVWQRTQAVSCAVAVGTAEERISAINRRAEITTINFENLPWLAKQIRTIENWYWDMVIIDESSRFRAGEGRTLPTKVKTVNKATGEIVVKARAGGNMTRFGVMTTARRKIKRIVELTGTPGDLKGLWGQSYLLDQGAALGRDKSDFEKRWFDKDPYNHTITPKGNAETGILSQMGDLAVTIPPKKVSEDAQFIPMRVRLPPKAMEEYRELEKTLYSQIHDVEAVSKGVLANKLMQMAGGGAYREDRSVAHVHEAKIEALNELLEMAPDENWLIFYGYKFTKDMILKHHPDAVVANEYKGDLVADWNRGKIKKLAAHPACLAGETEVLTEFRGWIKIADVLSTDRVFDGEQFVEHEGCSYSGFKPVISVFGIEMTPDHKILVNDLWERADSVGNSYATRERAQYTYKGDDARYRAMLGMLGDVLHHDAECQKTHFVGTKVLPTLCSADRKTSSYERQSDIQDLERHEGSLSEPEVAGLGELRRQRHFSIAGLANFREFFQRHGYQLPGVFHFGKSGRKRQLLCRKLHLGHSVRTTVKQTEQPASGISGGTSSSCGSVSTERDNKDSSAQSHEARNECRRSCEGREGFDVRNGAERDRSPAQTDGTAFSGVDVERRADVYDLVNCGPRHRFLIRNKQGDMFVSHNSIGHGTNLQYGGHLAAWFDLTWSLELWQQANMRLPRAGQTKQVLIYPIIAEGTYDERALDVLQEKGATQDRIIQNFLYKC